MIDARGLACPIPVVMVQKMVKEDIPSSLEVMVDDKCAVENVTRFANGQGYKVDVIESNGEFTLKLEK